MEKLSNSSQFLDLGGLDKLRARAQKHDKAALKEVAQQFEGIFVQMLMKSMREANAAFEADSPFNSQYTKFYEQMRDQQLSVELGSKGTLGLADLMVQQLAPEDSGVMPASVLRGALPATGSTAASHPLPPVSGSVDKILSGKALPTAQAKAEKAAEFSSPADFVSRLYPLAEKAANTLGTQPEVLLAQAALETGWGQKMVRRIDGEPSNNLFNIKADKRWDGAKARVSTTEFEQGIAVQQKADFRVYDSLAQSFDDFVQFISGSDRYQQAREAAANPQAFIQGLQNAGYATDPAYADKVMRVMKSVIAERVPGVKHD